MKIRWLLDNQACTSAYQADRRRLEEQVYPLQFEALRFQREITQDELGIVCAKDGKSLKTEKTVEFHCLSRFISWHSAISCCAYPDIVNAIICFFLLLHASPYLCMNEGIWVCVRERETKRAENTVPSQDLCEHLEELWSNSTFTLNIVLLIGRN